MKRLYIVLIAVLCAFLAWPFLRHESPPSSSPLSIESIEPTETSHVVVPSPTLRAEPVNQEGRKPAREVANVSPVPNAAQAEAAQPEPVAGSLEAWPFENARALYSRDTEIEGTDMFERVRVLRAEFKYPFLRVVERWVRDPTGGERLDHRVTMVANHILVKLQPDATEDDLVELNRAYGARILKKMLAPGMYLVTIPSMDLDSVPDAVSSYNKAADKIAYSEPDMVAFATQTLPNDPEFGQLYGLHNTGQSSGTADADIDAPELWDVITGGPVVVGVIDTGVEYTHEDLAANIWINPGEVAGDSIDNDGNGFVDDIHGWDFINNDNDPMDDNSHGTHVSGTIAGVGNNGIGVVGVNWTAKIMALKFLSAGGSGPVSDAIDCQAYANLMRQSYGINIRLTSNSWGGGGPSQAMTDVIEAARALDMLFIAAAGNSGRDNDVTPFYPSNSTNDNLIAVAATDRNDQKASFSNYGLTTVDLAAPGVSTYSTVLNNGYGNKSGTSMATPHVAGVAALIWNFSPTETYQEVRDVILLGADPVASMAGISVSGARLNALNAMLTLGMRVRSSTPDDNEIVASPPVDVVIEFTDEYNIATVQAADLSVNAIPADSFTLTTLDTVTFHFNTTPVTSEGLQTIQMNAGVVTRVSDGDASGEYTATFRYDTLPMQVVSTVPADDTTVTLPITTLRLNLNEPYDAATVSIGDLLLGQGQVTNFNLIDSDTIEYQLADVVNEGALTITLSEGALTDVHGNPIGPYSGVLHLDSAVVAYPSPFIRVDPPGSLIYDPSASAFITPASDTDSYTFSLDGGQTVSVLVNPDFALQPTIELRDPANALLGSSSSTGVGVPGILQTVAAPGSGTYTVTVGGAGGTVGAYSVQVFLNVALEDEQHGGAGNDILASAQDVNGSFISSGLPGVERAAVLGFISSTGSSPIFTEDFEGGTLSSAWSTYSSEVEGRIQVSGAHGTAGGTRALLMDRSTVGLNNLNEAIYTVDLTGQNQALLSFWHASWFDQQQTFGGPFVDHANSDGIAISDNGVIWEPLWSAVGTQPYAVWEEYELDLAVAAAAAGMHFNAQFRIKFQQYDNSPIAGVTASDGRGWDELAITSPDLTEDWYSFTLSQDDEVSLVLADLTDGRLELELHSASGLLAVGASGAANAEKSIARAVIPQNGTYYARVYGGGQEAYSLVLTRNARFDVEPNDVAADSTDISEVGASHGAIACPPLLFALDWQFPPPAHILQLDPVSMEIVNKFQAPIVPLEHQSRNNLAFDGQYLWYNGGTNPVNGVTIYKIDASNGTVVDTFTPSIPVPLGLAWMDGELFANDSAKTIHVFDDTTYAFKRSFNVASILALSALDADAKRGVLWGVSAQTLYKIDPANGTIISSGPAPREGQEQGLAVLCDEIFISELGEEIAVFDAETLTLLRRMDVPYAAFASGLAGVNTGEPEDWYSIEVNAGDPLVLSSETPSGDPQQGMEFLNLLDPVVELYDPTMTMVGSDDNSAADGKNVLLNHNAAMSGVYHARVVGTSSTKGEYVLSVAGATGAAPNGPPVVNAGASTSVTLPASANLDGTVSDDGEPAPPGVTTTLWTKVSGPGTVTFGDSAAEDTTAAFSLEGSYTLRLSAYDGALSGSDDLAVTVNAAPILGTATHAAAGYRSPGTNLVQCTFSYPGGSTLISLLWRPTLDAAWTLLDASGNGSPETNNNEIVFTGSLSSNPIVFSYTVDVPAGHTGLENVLGEVEYQLIGMANPVAIMADPDPLVLTQLVTLATSSSFGIPDPPEGTTLYAAGTSLSSALAGSPVTEGMTQYVALGWSGTGSVPASGPGTNTGAFTLNVDSSIQWLWRTNFFLDTETSGSGTVDVPDGWFEKEANVVITATPSANYHLDSWSGDTDGAIENGNQITVTMDKPRQVTANFAINQQTLAINSRYDEVVPPVGGYVHDYNTVHYLAVTNTPIPDGTRTQYVATGWAGSGSVPTFGMTTSVLILLEFDSVITWNWKTQVLWSATAGANGSVSATNGFFDLGTNGLSATAIPDTGSHFTGWTGDVPPGNENNNPLVVDLDQARNVAANFGLDEVDLAVTKTVNNATPDCGALATYTIVVTNLDAFAATGVEITDVLPSGVTYQSSTPNQGVYDEVSGIWTVGMVNAYTTAVLELVVQVDPNSTCLAGITNTAVLTNLDQVETNAANDAASVVITVTDVIPPTFTVPGAVTIECDESTAPGNTGDVTDEADNCSVGLNATSSDSSSGSCPEVITRTWTLTDDCGNSSNAVQTITVEDTTTPAFTAPGDVTIECDESTAPGNTGDVTDEADNCSVGLNATLSDSSSGSCPEVITRTWTLTDDCGNSSNAVQTITVEDTTAPTFTVPVAVTIECDESTAPANTGDVTDEADNCSVGLNATSSDSSSGSCPEVITRTWTLTDDCGNSSNAVQTITVEDATAPTFTVPGDVTIECDESTTPANTGDVTDEADNCSVGLNATSSDSSSGSCPEVITRTWTLTDDCGNSSNAVQTITVEDTTTPVFTVPGDVTIECDESTAPGNTGDVTDEADNCSVGLNATSSDSSSGSCPEVITRTWTLTDDCGNSSNAVQTITVEDTTAPMFTVPGGVTIECDESTAPANTGDVTDEADNCSVGLNATSSDSSSGSCPEVITRTWTLTDDCGNSSNAVQTITVEDATAPMFTVPANVTIECDESTAPANTGGVTDEADNCSVGLNATSSDSSSGSCPAVITRTWTLADDCGNSSNAVQTITVEDTTAPTFTVPVAVTIVCNESTDPSNTGDVTDENDNCDPVPGVSFADSVTGACPAGETITRTWTATDVCGNSSSALQTITALPQPFNLQVNSRYDVVDPAVGVASYDYGSALTLSVTNTPLPDGTRTQYVATGWSGSGSVPASGGATSVGITLEEDSSITWNWKTQVLYEVTGGVGGSVTASTGWFDRGAPASATANPLSGFLFSQWTGDVPPGSESDNPLNLTLDQARSIVAEFSMDPAAISASQSGSGYHSPGTTLVVSCQFDYPGDQSLDSFEWTPGLPAGWSMVSASGDGSPSLAGGTIQFPGSLAANPFTFSYSVSVPGNEPTTNELSGTASFQFTTIGSALPVQASPDPLAVSRYHSADYRNSFWSMDGSEVNRVLAYWRAGGYVVEPAGADGYAPANPPGTGNTNGGLHSADYLAPEWLLDVTEVNRVLAYWRAGGYEVNPAGFDGYAPVAGGAGGAGALGVDDPVITQTATPGYDPGGTVTVSNTFTYSTTLLSLAWRPEVPPGWALTAVRGGGSLEIQAGAILWLSGLPASPIQMEYDLEVPIWYIGSNVVGATVEYQFTGSPNPVFAPPVPSQLLFHPKDTDGDGLPDGWEQVYSGGPTNMEASGDDDGDGMNNINELLAGTNPNDSNSLLRLNVDAYPTDNGFTIQWQSQSNRSYAVSRATNLVAGFSRIVTNIVATPPVNTYDDTGATLPQLHYQVEVE